MKRRSTLFWALTQRVVLIPYRRFGTTKQGPRCSRSNLGYLASKKIISERPGHEQKHGMAEREFRLLDAYTDFGADSAKTSQRTSQSSGVTWRESKTICFRQFQAERYVLPAHEAK